MNKVFICIFGFLSIFAGYFGYRFGALIFAKKNMVEGLINALDNTFNAGMAIPSITTENQILAFLMAALLFMSVWFVWLWIFVVPKPERVGEEHGSASWADTKEIAKFSNKKKPDNNIVLTKNAKLATKRNRFSLKYDRNLNVLVVGGSGSGKTRYVVKPNLMQLYGNYVLTDPKGTTINECGYLFRDAGYKIKSFNTIDFSASNHWNPLRYVKTDADILSFVNCLIANTTGDKDHAGDPFWENSERLLYTALIALMRDWFDPSDFTLPNLIYLLSLAEVKEDDENHESPLDLMFKQIATGLAYRSRTNSPSGQTEEYDEWNRGLRATDMPSDLEYQPSRFVRRKDGLSPYQEGGLEPTDDYALLHYHMFKVAAGKTLKSIIISCNTRMEPIAISEVTNLMQGPLDKYGNPTGDCELELDKLGDPNEKVILFGIVSDTDKTFAFLLAMLMWQTINTLCNTALFKYGGKLPTLVSFVIDEFANIGKLPDIEQTIAVTRSRNISLTIILQSIAQLANNYTEEASKIIRGNCDTQLFLGGTDLETNKEISEMLGQQTIHTRTYGKTRGQMAGWSTNDQTQQRALLDPAEVGLVARDKAILIIKGARPYLDHKFVLEEHPRYEYIDPGHNPYKRKPAKYNESFDFKEYMRQKRSQIDEEA